MKFRGVYKNHSVCLSVCLSVRLSADLWSVLNLILVRRWLTIFSTEVYHHETMCHAFMIPIWYWPFDLFLVSFDIVVLCLALEFITISQCVPYIHDLCMIFDINIEIIFSPWIWVWQDCHCSLTKAYQILAYGCITMRQLVYTSWPLYDLHLYVGDGGDS